MPCLNSQAHDTRPARPIERRAAERGQILVVFAIFLVVLLGAAALTIDYASWLKVRRDYQNGADGAALAGATFLTRPIDSTKRTQARLASWTSLNSQLGLGISDPQLTALSVRDTPAATADEFADYRIWVSTPPIGLASTTAAKYPGASIGPDDRTVFVWVEKDNPSYFSGVFGQGNRVVSAWATAGARPNRFAVITLRKAGQNATGGAPADIKIGGTSCLQTQNGDLGGNWGLAISGSGACVKILQSTPDSFGVYLTETRESVPGVSSWIPSQITDGSGTQIAPQYTAEIPDPNYPLPPALSGAPVGPLATVPWGDSFGETNGQVSISSGDPGGTSTVGGVTKCTDGGVHIGPGYYTSISVANGKCLILDPVARYATKTTTAAAPGLPANQLPGIFYVNGTIDIGNGALVLGNGVTVIIRPDRTHETGNAANLLKIAGGAGSPSAMSLNPQTPDGIFTTAQPLGAWAIRNLTTGFSPYICTGTSPEICTYDASQENALTTTGMALDVIKRSDVSGWGAAVDNTTSTILVSANGALVWNGLTYAAHDNVSLAGQPGYTATGQIVSWTLFFQGGTNFTQVYQGPESGIPYLIEPHIGQ